MTTENMMKSYKLIGAQVYDEETLENMKIYSDYLPNDGKDIQNFFFNKRAFQQDLEEYRKKYNLIVAKIT